MQYFHDEILERFRIREESVAEQKKIEIELHLYNDFEVFIGLLILLHCCDEV
jgi:hypothetical protein